MDSVKFQGFYFVHGHPDKIDTLIQHGIKEEGSGTLNEFDTFKIQNQELEELVGRYDGEPNERVHLVMTNEHAQIFKTLWQKGKKEIPHTSPPYIQEFMTLASGLYARSYFILKNAMEHAVERMADLKEQALINANMIHPDLKRAIERLPLPEGIISTDEVLSLIEKEHFDFVTGKAKEWEA